MEQQTFSQQYIPTRRITVLLVVAITTLFFSSCSKVAGEGLVVTQNRSADNFTAISLRLSGTVHFKQDNVYKIDIKAEPNILSLIETPVINNQLIIRFKNNVNLGKHEEIVITISAPSVTSFDISGSGNFYSSGSFTPSDCKLQISGSGKMVLDNLVTNNLDAAISGSGNINVSGGTANSQTLHISGSGSMDLLNLSSKFANSATSGSGNVKVNLSDRLDARISGSGNVYYKGTPKVNASVSGSGKVVAL